MEICYGKYIQKTNSKINKYSKENLTFRTFKPYNEHTIGILLNLTSMILNDYLTSLFMCRYHNLKTYPKHSQITLSQTVIPEHNTRNASKLHKYYK